VEQILRLFVRWTQIHVQFSSDTVLEAKNSQEDGKIQIYVVRMGSEMKINSSPRARFYTSSISGSVITEMASCMSLAIGNVTIISCFLLRPAVS